VSLALAISFSIWVILFKIEAPAYVLNLLTISFSKSYEEEAPLSNLLDK
jgi:hypothetical protein